ncbi:hypothetical protein SISNIDRAFT_486506 [Sistotremastrum niveocremeum HHB9708]|uniref:MYND-type domain-containing protein n=1 Tax=Sistotremastrum niveocremeum HHB9708 TaxID=1314777 RepID=A0A164TLV0_9AGAM|nr:hypothetical protein SISNIDRAFT_486506 [Sistotremastrum niveocremeum HHB9708]
MPSKKQHQFSKSGVHISVIDSSSMSPAQSFALVDTQLGSIDASNAAVEAAKRGDHQTAANLHRQALEGKLKMFPETSIQAALSFNGLGEKLLLLGDIPGAEYNLTKALRVRDDESFGGLGTGPRYDAAVTRENMAQLREAQGRFEEAKDIRLRGKSKGQVCCGNYNCPGQMFLLSELKSCSKCSCVFYCSPDCQLKDWDRHKDLCKAERARRKAQTVEEEKEEKAANPN